MEKRGEHGIRHDKAVQPLDICRKISMFALGSLYNNEAMKETDKIYPADKGEEELLHNVRHILQEARAKVIHHVNSTLVRAYWQVGKYIVEYEQQGTGRAGYGKAVINTLSRRLVAEFGNGFTATNLRYMRQFYQCYPKYHTLCDKLSWSHCRTLLKVSGDAARDFYLHECVKENWSVRQLDRQINTLFYDRLLASRDKKAVKEEISRTEPGRVEPKEIIRDPYILEFLGIPQGEHFLETDLEQLLISRLQRLMLELGKGFAFVARQKRISFDDKHFYIDLVFYNYLARCFVLIDLKSGELTHQDLGQMQMYVNYYTRELMNPGDNPPVGIVLCAEKNDAVVRYTLPEDEKQVFAAQYMTYLPTQEELQTLLQEV